MPTTLAARMVRPPHGTIFITPYAPHIVPRSACGRIPIFLQIGRNAGTTIRKVVAPEPSKCATNVVSSAAKRIVVTFFPALLIRNPMIGSKV